MNKYSSLQVWMEANLQQSKQSKLTKKVQTLALKNGEHKLVQSQALFKQAHPVDDLVIYHREMNRNK